MDEWPATISRRTQQARRTQHPVLDSVDDMYMGRMQCVRDRSHSKGNGSRSQAPVERPTRTLVVVSTATHDPLGVPYNIAQLVLTSMMDADSGHGIAEVDTVRQ
ncbi:hypothetical protein GN958_ATG17193 [Phytophthora infestans]|uniref:Uncharacterized protein n=1 Tax=Phytophthora infestans TaxID=4787 RepID=A0A8S9TYU2_PHYIN|nr:hypothetical protein GN958_ATG17193 [Phytophthora infestans]